MDFHFKDNALTTSAYLRLREAAGWIVLTEQQAEKALEKSLFTVAAISEGRIIGMGRLVGDGCVIWYIQDVIVHREHQGKGVGRLIVKRLIDYAKENSLPNTVVSIGLMSSKGKDEFYSKLGFRTRPNENEGSGMIMRINI